MGDGVGELCGAGNELGMVSISDFSLRKVGYIRVDMGFVQVG